MNPILATTIEFDDYINSRLQSNNKIPVRTTSSRTALPSQRPPSAQSRKSTYSKEDSGLSQDFLEVNSKKYIFSDVSKSGVSTSSRDKNKSNCDTIENEFEDPLTFKHSWRGHLVADNAQSATNALKVTIPSIDNKKQFNRNTGKWHSDSSPLPNPPLPYNQYPRPILSPSHESRLKDKSEVTSPDTRSPLKYKGVPASSNHSSHRQDKHLVSVDKLAQTLDSLSVSDDEQQESLLLARNRLKLTKSQRINDHNSQHGGSDRYQGTSRSGNERNSNRLGDDALTGQFSLKARSVVLARFFQSWQVEARISRGLLAAKSRLVDRGVTQWLKRVVLRNWGNLMDAVVFGQRFMLHKEKLAIRRWSEVARHKRSVRRRVDKFRLRSTALGFLACLRSLVLNRRSVRKHHSLARRALSHFSTTLLQWVVGAWKLHTKRAKSEKQLGDEQTRRREKIQQFIANMSSGRATDTHSAANQSSTATRAENQPQSQQRDLRPVSSSYLKSDAKAQSKPRASSAGRSMSGVRGGPAKSSGPEQISGMTPRGASSKPHVGNNYNNTAASSAVRSGSTTRHRPFSGTTSPLTTGHSNTASREAQSKLKRSGVVPSTGGNKNGSIGSSFKDEPRMLAETTAYDQDEFEPCSDDEDESTPPPSYSASTSAIASVSAHRGGAGDREPEAFSVGRNRVHAASHNTWVNGSGGTQNKTLATTDLPDFERRALERREKVAVLRKQAEQRVAQRQLESDARNREKIAKEAEEAEKIRRDSRLRLEQTKAQATRLTETTDALKRQLQIAKAFRRTQLLIQFGFAPWRRLIEHIRVNELKARNFHCDRLLQTAWSALLAFVVTLRTERFRKEHRQASLAVSFFRRKLMRRVWKQWRLHHKALKTKAAAVTGHFSRFTLCRRSFRAWKVALERRMRDSARKMRAVAPRGDRCVLRHCWRLWRSHLETQLFEREIRNRTDHKWAAVQGWLNKK